MLIKDKNGIWIDRNLNTDFKDFVAELITELSLSNMLKDDYDEYSKIIDLACNGEINSDTLQLTFLLNHLCSKALDIPLKKRREIPIFKMIKDRDLLGAIHKKYPELEFPFLERYLEKFVQA